MKTAYVTYVRHVTGVLRAFYVNYVITVFWDQPLIVVLLDVNAIFAQKSRKIKITVCFNANCFAFFFSYCFSFS